MRIRTRKPIHKNAELVYRVSVENTRKEESARPSEQEREREEVNQLLQSVFVRRDMEPASNPAR